MKIKMKLIGIEKRQVGINEYENFYLVQFPENPDTLDTTYYGNGKRGNLYSFVPLFQRYGKTGWNSERLDDLRDKDVPVPTQIKKHILQLLRYRKMWIK